MKKLIFSLLAISSISPTVLSVISCNTDSVLKVEDTELSYLMEQYSKAVYSAKDSDVNVDKVFKTNILNESNGILTTKTNFKTDKFRYKEVFDDYFSENNYLAADIKINGVDNVVPSNDGSSLESISSLLGTFQTIIDSLQNEDLLTMVFKFIYQGNLLSLLTNKMSELISYGSVLFDEKYIKYLKDALKPEAYIGMTYQETLESSVIGLSNAIHIIKTDDQSNLIDEYKKDEIEGNYKKATSSFLSDIDKKNTVFSSWNNKIRAISEIVKFATSIMFYLNHFLSDDATAANNFESINIKRKEVITDLEAYEFDFAKFNKVLEDILNKNSTTRVNSFSKLLSPLFLYKDGDLKVNNFSLKTMSVDIKELGLNLESNEKPDQGLSYFLLSYLNTKLKNLEVDGISGVINFTNGKLNVAAAVMTLFNLMVNDKKIDAGLLKIIINGYIDKLNIRSEFKACLKDLFSSASKSLIDLIEIVVPDNNSMIYKLFSYLANITSVNISFKDLSNFIDILGSLKYLKNNEYDKFLLAIGYDTQNNTLIADKPLSALTKFIKKISGSSEIIKIVNNYISEIIKKKTTAFNEVTEKIKTASEESFSISKVGKNNIYSSSYIYKDVTVTINVKQYKNKLIIEEINVN